MEKKVKKRFAREFLFIVALIALYFSCLLIWSLLIKANRESVSELNGKIESASMKYSRKLYDMFPDGYFKDEIELNDYVALNGIKEFTPYLIEQGFFERDKDVLDFYYFNYKKDSSNDYLNVILPIEKELSETKSSFFHDRMTTYNMFTLLGICFFLLFILRYMVYGVIWSLNQYQKGE